MKRVGSTVSLVLLVLIAADAAAPQPCCLGFGETRSSTSSSLYARELTANNTAGSIFQGSPQQDQSDQTSCEDDCLCCAHAMAGSRFTGLTSFCHSNPQNLLSDDQLPSPQLRAPYHPPRSA